jgi:hypothetical protein
MTLYSSNAVLPFPVPLTLRADLGAVRFELMGNQLALDGWVPSYDAKRKIEAAARAAGFRIQNCLRVLPGLATTIVPAPSPESLL